jgi:hypothetical protein
MAIAGAGNPVGGSNPSGTSQGLNYIGDHVFAMSGQIDVDDNEKTLLEFVTVGGIITSKIQFNSMNEEAQECQYQIYINDEVVVGFLAGNNAPDYRGKPNGLIEIILPPYSKVKMTAKNNDDSASLANQVVTVMGRVYA